jgi:Tol biopolymer transport system component
MLSSDGRTLYFDRGATANRDIFMATRTGRDAPWTNVQIVPVINDLAEDDSRFATTVDQLDAVMSSIRSGFHYDLYETTRPTTGDMFGTPSITTLANLDAGAFDEVDPIFTSDGLGLYYATNPTGAQQIMHASRAAVGASFGSATMLGGLGSSSADPAISPDELVLVFTLASSFRQLFFATRADQAATFGNVTPLTSITGPSNDADAVLSTDGCELLFSSDRAGDYDIWSSVVLGFSP